LSTPRYSSAADGGASRFLPPVLVTDRSSLDRVREALGNRVQIDHGDQLYAVCPVPEHDDRQPSLSLTWMDDRRKGGRVLVNCHRGCHGDDVVAAMGLGWEHLFDTPPARPADGTRTDRPQRRAAGALKPKSDTQAQPRTKRRGKVSARYAYRDLDGVLRYEVMRWDPKGFSCRQPADDRKWIYRAPAAGDRLLYRLPEVVAAIAAGRPVFLVDGEKDADALVAAGQVATTAPFGSPAANAEQVGKKWLPQYTETVRGADLVIVVDWDSVKKGLSGQRYALYLQQQLTGVANRVQLVRAATGKDAADHLAAGHGVDELVPVEAAELAAMVATVVPLGNPDSSPDHGDGGQDDEVDEDQAEAGSAADAVDLQAERAKRRGQVGDDERGGGGDEPPTKIRRVFIRDKFKTVDDGPNEGLYHVQFKGSESEMDRRQEWRELLPAVPKIVRRLRHDLGDGADVRVTHWDLEVNKAGETVQLAAVTEKEWKACSWIDELPWSLPADDTIQARSKLRKAILATSGPAPVETLYGRLGWWQIGDEWVYLHAGGAIGADGPTSKYRVKVSQKYEVFALPAPASDAKQLRQAVMASLAMMDTDVPDRLAAPMLCAAWRACLGYSRVTVVPTGLRASGKTGLAAVAQQHYAPGANFRSLPFGAGEDAATVASLEEHRFVVGDMLQVLDDLAPDKGTETLARRQNSLARTQAERRGKDRRTRELGMRAEHKPNGMLAITTEQWQSIESAETRIVGLEMTPGEIAPKETFGPLDRNDGPMLRAMLTATMVKHYAKKMPLTDWIGKVRDDLQDLLADPTAVDQARGIDDRRSEAFADLAVGMVAMTEMARELGALTEAEEQAWYSRIWDGLVEAKKVMVARSSVQTPKDQISDMLGSLLTRKKISLSMAGRDDEPDENPELFGWEKAQGGGHYGFDQGWRRVGEQVGWVDQEKGRLYLTPSAVTEWLGREARGAGITWPHTAQTLADVLDVEGVLQKEKSGRKTRTVRCAPGGTAKRVWDLSLAWLFPPDDDDHPAGTDGDSDDGPDGDILPSGPRVDPLVNGTSDDEPAAGKTASGQNSETATELADQRTQEPAMAAPADDEPADGRAIAANKPAGRAVVDQVDEHADTADFRPYDGPAVVCGTDGGWVATLYGKQQHWLWTDDLGTGGAGLAALLSWAATTLHLGHQSTRFRKARHAQGAVYVTPALRKQLQLPASLPATQSESKIARGLRDAMAAGGWEVGKAGLSAWTKVWRPGGRSMLLVVPEWLSERRGQTTFGEDDAATEPQQLARRLGLYAAITHHPYHWSAGVTGHNLILRTRPELAKTRPEDVPQPPKPALMPELEMAYGWRRSPTSDERSKAYAIAIDIHGQHLGAASSLELPTGPAEHVGPTTFDLTRDGNRHGYWYVDLARWTHARLPDPVAVALRNARDRLWVTTPTLRTWVELCDMDPPAVHDSYLWPCGEPKTLSLWQQVLRDARKSLLPGGQLADGDLIDEDDRQMLLRAVKDTYSATVGRFDAERFRDMKPLHRLYRPSWRHHIIAQSRWSLTRRLFKTAEIDDAYPLAIAVDAIVYASDDPTWIPSGFTKGTGLGQVETVGALPMDKAARLLKPNGPLGLMDAIKDAGIST
jgi:hypothetical protein